MKKKSTSTSASASRSVGEAGFFNLRVLVGLVVALAGIFIALGGFGTFSNVSAQANVASKNSPGHAQQFGQTTVIPVVRCDASPPRRDQPVVWPQTRQKHPPHVHPKIPFKHHNRPDPVIQRSFWQPLMTTPAIPAPINQWAGIVEEGPPPDTNGAVGKTHYLEMVNSGLQVFDKLTGASLLGPIPISSFWSGFGGVCETEDEGDPIVVYDRLADRWLISQFATPRGASDPQDECIAVSQTGDATGTWYRYQFHLSDQFADYEKFGVWPDGYYVSSNILKPDCERDCYLGAQAFVFDRAKMLVGDCTATAQTPGLNPPQREAPFLPSDLDGILPPPAGEPNHFVQSPVEVPDLPPEGAQETDPRPSAYKIWDFHVDWIHPANTSFSRRASVSAEDFALLCEDPETRDCVPQLGTSQKVDILSVLLMFRNAYRRFADGRESMLNNFTVDAEGVGGIRWFELQRAPAGNWAVHQDSTYAPDSTWRWAGSIASDNQGNIALGFSASSAAIYPQIRYAGRLATDPLNILSGEQHLFDGTGSQGRDCEGNCRTCGDECNRWGDYSDMTVDPVDDCTFYYTNEYHDGNAPRDSKTRIGYFRFSECTPPQKGTAHFVVSERAEPLSKALVSIDGMTYGATVADGSYDAVLPPGTHTYAVSHPESEPKTGNFTITNNQTTLVEVVLEAGPRPSPTPPPRPTPPR
jgi:hypothetical protein